MQIVDGVAAGSELEQEIMYRRGTVRSKRHAGNARSSMVTWLDGLGRSAVYQCPIVGERARDDLQRRLTSGIPSGGVRVRVPPPALAASACARG
jgi:hypothetical protein